MYREILVTMNLLDRVSLIFPPLLLMLRDGLPSKGQAPVKITPAVLLPILNRFGKFKGVQVNGGDIWTNHGSGFFRDT